jgi:hypothetical protein
MTIHPTAITFHDCRIHLEPIGPEPGIPEQRYRRQVEYCASTEAILGSAIRQWVIGAQYADPMSKACRFIATARLASGQVEIAANNMAARAEACAILEGHKANLDRITDLEDQAEKSQKIYENCVANNTALTRERDEARQMHKERAFYDRAHLEAENTRLGMQLQQARMQLQAITQKCSEITIGAPSFALATKISELAKL